MLQNKQFTDIYLGERARFFSGIPGCLDPVPAEPEDENELDGLRQRCQEMHASSGRDEFNTRYENVTYRVSLLQTIEELVFVLRRFPSTVPPLDSLGLPKEWVDRLMTPRLSGLICISGPYGQGKTTTASSLLSARLGKFGGVGVTIEDPPEMPLEGQHGEGYCFQTEALQGNFAQACRQAARWAPSIIFLGEVRDSETAAEALRASINGRLVICTTHSDDIPSTVDRLYSLANGAVGTSEDTSNLLSQGLSMVLQQELISLQDRKVPRVKFLSFVEEDHEMSVRNLVRDRKFPQLETAVNLQLNRMRMRGLNKGSQ